MANPKNLLECVYHWEKKTPQRICFVQPMGGGDANLKTWTWQEAVDEARRMAAYLKGLNFPERSHIALCSKNCAHWIMADLAIWMAGHISIPIYPILTPDMVSYLLDHSESKLLFAGKLEPVWEDMKQGIPEGLPVIGFPYDYGNEYTQWDDIISNHAPIADPAERTPDEMATIIYTSGSTGKPKGAMVSFDAMYQSAKGININKETTSADRMLSYLPLAHVFERWIVECAFFEAGFKLFFAESLDTFVKDLQRARPTLFISVPRLWLKFQLGIFQKIPEKKLDLFLKIPILNSIIKKKILKGLGLDQVRVAGSGSAPMPKEILEWYRSLGLDLLEGYAMTENFGYSHCSVSGEVRPGYVGPPYPDVSHKLSDDGEVLIKSPGNMMGYYKMPDKTEETFTEDGFIKTGDLGEIDEKNRLKLTGRAKELFKTSKGKYVAPAPIENMLVNHPMVEACIVSGSGYAQPYGVLMLAEDARQQLIQGETSNLASAFADHLEKINTQVQPYERLAFLALVRDEWLTENGFLTPTMKIKRAMIEKTYGPLADEWFERKQPVVWQAA